MVTEVTIWSRPKKVLYSPWHPSGFSRVKFQNPFMQRSHLGRVASFCTNSTRFIHSSSSICTNFGHTANLGPPTFVLQWHCPATVPKLSSVIPSHMPPSVVPSGSQSQAEKGENVLRGSREKLFCVSLLRNSFCSYFMTVLWELTIKTGFSDGCNSDLRAQMLGSLRSNSGTWKNPSRQTSHCRPSVLCWHSY